MNTLTRFLFAIMASLSCLAYDGTDEATGFGDGESIVNVAIHVIDDKTGADIIGAKIWLLTGKDAEIYALAKEHPESLSGPIEALGYRVLSGMAGSVTIPAHFKARGKLTWKTGKEKETGSWQTKGHIEVTNFGYEPFIAQLEDLTASQSRDLADKDNEINLLIKLKRPMPKPCLDIFESFQAAQDFTKGLFAGGKAVLLKTKKEEILIVYIYGSGVPDVAVCAYRFINNQWHLITTWTPTTIEAHRAIVENDTIVIVGVKSGHTWPLIK